MKWMMVVMLMAGLSGCHWLDQTRVTGTGAVVERQQVLGDGVTRVLAGVPATLHLVAGGAARYPHQGAGESAALSGADRERRQAGD